MSFSNFNFSLKNFKVQMCLWEEAPLGIKYIGPNDFRNTSHYIFLYKLNGTCDVEVLMLICWDNTILLFDL